jgi:hypothetical protein
MVRKFGRLIAMLFFLTMTPTAPADANGLVDPFFASLGLPDGVTTDLAGNVFVSGRDQFARATVSRLAADGSVVWTEVIVNSPLGPVGRRLRLITDPANGLILTLRDTGQITALNPETRQQAFLLDLHATSVDMRTVWDVYERQLKDFTKTGASSLVYGDFAINRRQNGLDLFLTGETCDTTDGIFSSCVAPISYIIRVRATTGQAATVKMIVVSTIPKSFQTTFRGSRGIAATAGFVLTTLPADLIGGFLVDEALASFSTDFEPAAGFDVTTAPKLDTFPNAATAHGMSSDDIGRFYLATDDNAFCIGGAGVLIFSDTVVSNAEQCVALGVANAVTADVAVSPDRRFAYMTYTVPPQFGTIIPREIKALARFTLPPPLLTLTVSVVGSGTITSSPAGIACPGANCAAPFESGTAVALNAIPAVGWSFERWSGACTGSGACVVNMSAAESVTATFQRIQILITTQPTDQTVNAGQNASFTVAAVGTPTPSYQWQVSSDNGVTWTNVTATATNGATTPTLTVAATTLVQGTRYRALVKNLGATVMSQPALLTVNSMTANPATVFFGATKAGAAGALQSVTPAQDLTVLITGSPGNWTASANQSWVQITNGTGTGNGRFTVGISNPTNVLGAATTANATITLTAAPSGLTTIVPLTLTIQQSGRSAPPFGAFDTPVNGSTGMQGSFAVTGWALDDTAINRVEIWRDRAPGETTPVYPGPGPGTGKIFIANALFIAGARPDVETAFASTPQANRAGWGYLLLSWGLFNQGNGPFTLYAFAFDQEEQFTTLGTKAITVNNANANRPFGALDVPGLGDTKSGTFFNFGWALTPNATPSCIITNGNVFMAVDSGALQAVNYGDLRPDIAAGFPGFSNGNNAGGAFALDTTTLSNGTHQIGWFVVDSCGRADGIGSRFFTVLNGGSATAQRADVGDQESRSEDRGSEQTALQIDGTREPVEVRRAGEPAAWVWPRATGTRVVPIGQGERVEVGLPRARASYVGSQVINREQRALPLGSSLDASTGTFYWQPAPGFLGSYDLEFASGDRTSSSPAESPVRVRAVVGPPMRMTIDAPQAGAVVASSFLVGGWALDLAAENGSGIDTVHVWAYPIAGGDPRFLGVAAVGDARPDVVMTFGDQFLRSSYNLWVSGLRRGMYDLVVYAHRAATGAFEGAQVVRVTIR